MRVLRFLLLSILPLLASPCLGQPLLNEILYDPPGVDADAEFVELLNVSPDALDLAGLELLFVNGSDPSVEKLVWRAPEGLWLGPGAFLVVGGERVAERDVTASLGLQNGPDGLRLRLGGIVRDAVAWGDLTGVGEGEPAVDVAGTSLGRIPDGADSGDNRTDWKALPQPTPGRRNLEPTRLVETARAVSPPWRCAPGSLRVELWLVAEGSAELQEAPLRWALDGIAEGEQWLRVARGDTAALSLELWLGEGRHEVLARWGTEACPDSARFPLRVGPAPVALNELMIRPLPEAPEWIELVATGEAMGPIEMEGWSIADAGGERRGLPEDARIEPGGYLLLCESPELLVERPVEVLCLRPEGGWPALNNGAAGSDEPADELLLFDASGTVVDRVGWTGREAAAAGHTLERGSLDSAAPCTWFVSPSAPTPGRPNATADFELPTRGLRVAPLPFTPDGDGREDLLHAGLALPAPAESVAAEILDLSGDRVRGLEAPDPRATLLQWVWDGRDGRGRPAPLGAYLLRVRVQADGGVQVFQALVALGRRR